MARTLTASDRRSLIRLASTLPVGSSERKAILKGLSKVKVASSRKAQSADEMTPSEIEDILIEHVDEAHDDVVSEYEAYSGGMSLAALDSKGADAAYGLWATSDSGASALLNLRAPKAAKVMRDFIGASYKSATKAWMVDNAAFISENGLTEDQINPSDLSEMGFDSEAGDLAESMDEWPSGDDITFRLGAFYFGPDNSRVGRKGEHNIEVFSLIEFDGYFFKDGRIDTYRSDFSFTSERELKSKLTKALDAAVKSL